MHEAVGAALCSGWRRGVEWGVSLKVVGQTASERPDGVGQSSNVPSCVEGATMEGERSEQGGCEGEVWA